MTWHGKGDMQHLSKAITKQVKWSIDHTQRYLTFSDGSILSYTTNLNVVQHGVM